jgi:glutamine---fructose-6-phosphate transaminase (isomerizing)
MCGIVGAVAKKNINVTAQVLQCLKKLEYRGYDSAGVAAWQPQRGLQCLKMAGKVDELITAERSQPLLGNIAIAHTRWATHGEPNDRNAHPHLSHNKLALVHNGIIEGYDELKKSLLQDGYKFLSETDTEVLVHAIHRNLVHALKDKTGTAREKHNGDSGLLYAVQQTISALDGSFALAVIDADEPGKIILARRGSPLVVGLGDDGNFISSDQISLLEFTNKFIYLEEGDLAVVKSDSVQVYDEALNLVSRTIKTSRLVPGAVEKGGYAHYMLKEIYEQPQTIKDTLHIALENAWLELGKVAPQVKRVQIVACGSSYNAGLIAHYWFETLARVPCEVETASEFRYRDVAVHEGTLFVTISQSGETADTLAALRWATEQSYVMRLAICNVPESSLVRESDLALMIHAGVEVGVVATKTVTAQLVAIFLLGLILGREKGVLSLAQYDGYIHQLKQLPIFVEQVLLLDEKMQQVAQKIVTREHAFYLGRGINYPVALEGALKFKETSYLHAEAYPAGELKHGPLAVVDNNTPVVVLAPHDQLWDKIYSNMQSVMARGGELLVLTDNREQTFDSRVVVIKMPKLTPLLTPIIYLIPLQLLAYHVAVLRGANVDQPRNLAKSVTVE